MVEGSALSFADGVALDPCLIYDTDRYGWIGGPLCACAPVRLHCRRPQLTVIQTISPPVCLYPPSPDCIWMALWVRNGLVSARWLLASGRYQPNFDPLCHVDKKHTTMIWQNGFMITLLFYNNGIKPFRCNTCIIFTSHILIYRYWIFEQLSTPGNQTKMVWHRTEAKSFFTGPLIYIHIECLVQDCRSDSIANALELLPSYIKPSI